MKKLGRVWDCQGRPGTWVAGGWRLEQIYQLALPSRNTLGTGATWDAEVSVPKLTTADKPNG